jgi:hypothetical protein
VLIFVLDDTISSGSTIFVDIADSSACHSPLTMSGCNTLISNYQLDTTGSQSSDGGSGRGSGGGPSDSSGSDGGPTGGLLLQIFTQDTFGPIFFEIIQRKGNEGFGNGNFQALFDSIELDQIRRGVIKVDA